MPLLNIEETSKDPYDAFIKLWKLNNIDRDKTDPVYTKFANFKLERTQQDIVPDTPAKIDFNLNYLKLDPEDLEIALKGMIIYYERKVRIYQAEPSLHVQGVKRYLQYLQQLEDTLSYLQNLMKHSPQPSSSHSSHQPQPSRKPLLNIEETSKRPYTAFIKLWKLNNIDRDKTDPVYTKFANFKLERTEQDIFPDTPAKIDFNLNYLKLDPEDLEIALKGMIIYYQKPFYQLHYSPQKFQRLKQYIQQLEDTLSYLQNLMKHSSPSSSHSSHDPRIIKSYISSFENKYMNFIYEEELTPKPTQLTPEFASKYPAQASYYFNNGIAPWRIEDTQYVLNNYGIKTALGLVETWGQ